MPIQTYKILKGSFCDSQIIFLNCIYVVRASDVRQKKCIMYARIFAREQNLTKKKNVLTVFFFFLLESILYFTRDARMIC